MIIYLYGDDGYRIEKELNQYVSKFFDQYGSSLEKERFSLSEKGGFEKIKDFFSISSMFGGHKLAILNGLDKFSGLEDLKNFMDSSQLETSEEEILIVLDIFPLQEGWQGKRKEGGLKKYFLKISKESKELNVFNNLFEAKKWIEEELDEEIEEKAVKLLFDNFGKDTGRLAQEIEKLSLYKLGGRIEEEDVEEICDLKSQIYVFNIFDAFLSRDREKAALFYKQALQSGVEAQAIFNLFIDQIRTAVYAVEDKKEFLAGIKPFKLKKIKEKMDNFSKNQILNIFQILSDSDDAIKNGRISFDLAMEYILLSF